MFSSMKILISASLILSCTACDNDRPGNDTPPQSEAAAPSPPSLESLPASGAFVGRAWLGVSSGPERGHVLVFLPDRTLLTTPCPGQLRLTEWGLVNGNVRWREQEGSIPIEAELSMEGDNELHLRIVGRDEEIYMAITAPFACPEMPPQQAG